MVLLVGDSSGVRRKLAGAVLLSGNLCGVRRNLGGRRGIVGIPLRSVVTGWPLSNL